MTPFRNISILFYIGAAYDGLLGLLFLFFPLRLFAWYGVEPPNHLGYVHFPAAILIIFGVMFFNIAKRPLPNRNLIYYGILLKIAYSGVVIWHWIATGIPSMWKPFALIDIGFGLLFAWACFILHEYPRSLSSNESEPEGPRSLS
jgi:hypothetical protein